MMDRRNQTLPASIEILESLILMSASSIEGTDVGEWISGTSLDDAIQAGGGDDEIHASMGHNLIDGGSGTDTLVVYEGLRADFAIQRFPDGRVLVEGPGLNGVPVVNELQNVERIAFNDEMVLTDDLAVADQTLSDQSDVASTVQESAAAAAPDPQIDDETDLREPEEEGSAKSASAKSASAKSASEKSASAKSGSARSASEKSDSAKSVSDKSNSSHSTSEKSGSAKSGSAKSASDKSGSGKSASVKSSSANSAKSESSVKSVQSDSASPAVIVEPQPVNHAPLTRNDEYRVTAEQSLVGNVLANDSDPDADQLQVSLAAQPQHGSVVLNRDGDFSYIPQQGFTGTDTFRYQLSDGRGGLTVGIVTIDVRPTEQPKPVVPVGEDDVFRFEAGIPLSATVSGNDQGGAGATSELLYELIEDVDSGQLDFHPDGSFDYVADEQPASASFQYRVTDSSGAVSLAQVELIPTARPVPLPLAAEPVAVESRDPAPPVAEWPAPLPPEPAPPEPPAVPVDFQPDADADVIAAAVGEPLVVNVLQNDSDPDGDDLTVVSHTQAEHGTATVSADGTLTYSADDGFTGIDFLYYSVSDGDQTDQATIVIHVNATGELPDGLDESVTAEMVVSPIVFDLNEDGQIGVTGETTARDKSGITEIGRTVEFDLDADGRAESIEWIDGRGDAFLVDSSQIRGTDIDGRALFGDEGGRYANGFEKLELFDRDGNGLIEAQEFGRLRLWVDNGDGVLQAGELETLQQHDVFAIDTRMELTADGLMQSVAFVGNDAEILIEDVWFAEQDAEPESAPPGDSSDNSDNQDPDANPDLISVVANTDVVAQVLNNDRDGDGGTLRVVSHTRAIHGEVVVTDDGQLRYTPDPDFVGNDYVQYTISDGQGGTDTAIAVLQVRPLAAGAGQADGPDAGASEASASGTISGTVWEDVNQNGLREDSEQGRGDGVFVSLLNGEGVVTQSVHTDSAGAFTFDDLAEGRYSIRIDQNSLPSAAGQQAQLTWQDVNSDFLNAVDSDIDRQTGESSTVGIGSAQSLVRIDAGYYFA